MTTINNPTKKRSLRRWFKQVCSSFIKRLNCNCCDEIAILREKYQELEELLDVVAQEIGRQSKRPK